MTLSRRISTAIRRISLVTSLLLAAGCATATQHAVPVPNLSNGAAELRVAYVVNHRLPKMTAEQLQILLNSASQTAKEHFGITLTFTPVTEIPIDQIFRQIPPEKAQQAAKHIYDFKSGQGDPKQLALSFGREFKRAGEPLPAMLEYVRPYTGEFGERSYEALGAAMARLQLERIERWKQLPAPDGRPAIDATPYNEYVMWDALGYGNVPYDLLITNQLIASVEDIEPSVHSAIRGGYCNGITTYSKASRYGTFSIWSTFAFTSSDPWVLELRKGESYTAEEAARLAGIAATHELGHLMFHFLHPYDNPACIMDPVPMFSYRAWSAKLSPKNCPIGSSPAMTPGAYTFVY
jgi:hypothetical protein